MTNKPIPTVTLPRDVVESMAQMLQNDYLTMIKHQLTGSKDGIGALQNLVDTALSVASELIDALSQPEMTNEELKRAYDNAKQRRLLLDVLDSLDAITESDWRTWQELASEAEFERWVKSRTNHAAITIRAALAQPVSDDQPYIDKCDAAIIQAQEAVK